MMERILPGTALGGWGAFRTARSPGHRLAVLGSAKIVGLRGRRAILRISVIEPVLLRVLLRPAELAILRRVGTENALVVLGVLEVVFRRDPVARRGGVARHGQILLQDLTGRAAHLDVGTGAVESLGS